MTPKLARAGPKIFDKVRAFEERRASVDLPGGVGSVLGSGFGRPASFDLDDSGKKKEGPSKEEGHILQGAAQKRAAFKQRASSLEDKTSYSQRVQSYQSKFAEELQRIKKLVGKPSLKKAYSTEQLSQKEGLTRGKLEPIPPQVVKKLEARERAEHGRKDGEGDRSSTLQISLQAQGKGLGSQSNDSEKHKMTQPDSQGNPMDSSSRRSTGKIFVTMETAPVHQLPGQPLPTATRTSLTRFGELSLLMNLCAFKIIISCVLCIFLCEVSYFTTNMDATLKFMLHYFEYLFQDYRYYITVFLSLHTGKPNKALWQLTKTQLLPHLKNPPSDM